MSARDHSFHAIAFMENFSLKDAARVFPEGKVGPHELRAVAGPGELFAYRFGALVFRNVSAEARDEAMARLRSALPGLTPQVVREELVVREGEADAPAVKDGVLHVDALTPARSAVVALTVGQSAAMEYYERIVDQLAAKTSTLVATLERTGRVPLRTRPLHRFIGAALSTRAEVLSVLHLLDKPDATWDDPAMDLIYNDLRAEFDLVDRFQALERQLALVQGAAETFLDAARDRRLVALEAAIVLLIVVEIVLSLVR